MQYMQYLGKNNFPTNMLKAYLSAQGSPLSSFVISKTHISGQKPHGRQLNTKVCSHESAIFRILLSCYDHDVLQRYIENGLSTHRHFNTKLILITTQSSTITQSLDSFKFALVDKSHSQYSVVAIHCEGCHFLMVPVRYRPNAASGGWSYGHDLLHCSTARETRFDIIL